MKRTTLLLMLFSSINGFSQAVYIDAVTPAVTLAASKTLETEQQDTNEKLSQIKQTQAFLNAQLAKVNDVQNKVRKGLTEVNGTLQNGIMIKRIGYNTLRAYEVLEEIGKFIVAYPQYAPFATSGVNRLYTYILESYTLGQQAVTSDEFNWMNAGQRHEILNQVDIDIRTVSVIASGLLSKLVRSKRMGFLRAIDPFNQWYVDDLTIINEVMYKYDRIQM